MKRITNYLMLCVMILTVVVGLVGCGALNVEAQAEGLADEEFRELIDQLDAFFRDEPQQPVETGALKRSVSAYGPFSEGKAFAFENDSPCYIDTNGNVLFYIETGYYGFPFHEGTAVIVDEDLYLFEEGLELNGPRNNRQVQMINEHGGIVVPAGKYCFIGAMKNGLSMAYGEDAGYNGTQYKYDFIDRSGHVDLSITEDALDIHHSGEIKNWSELGFNKSGYCRFELKGINNDKVAVIDRSGNVCYRDAKPWNGTAHDTDRYFMMSTRNSSEQYFIEYGSFGRAVTYTSKFVDSYFSPELFTGEYTIGFVKNKYIAKADNYGNILSKNELSCYRMTDTRDGYIVMELANDYYGVADYDLNLLFEPIQAGISYMGDGLFLAGSTILNDRGERVGHFEHSWKRCRNKMTIGLGNIPYIDPEFSEGWCIIYDVDLGKPVYTDKTGTAAPFC